MHNENYTENLLDKLSACADALSIEELKQLQELFISDDGRNNIEAWMFEKWDQAKGNDCPDFNGLLDRVEQQLKEKYTKRRVLLHTFMKYAAIFFIPLLGAFAYLLVKITSPEPPIAFAKVGVAEQEYISPVGMRSKVTLHDSTVVWMNADSRLIVAAGFNEKTRNVRLIGEAYFEVKKKEDNMAFTVSTPEMDIKVLGTSFNVSAYPESPIMQTVLVEGQIEAIAKGKSSKEKKETQVAPSQLLTLQKNNYAISLKEGVNTDLYTSWKTGKLIFRSAPMDEIARTLERWFNVNIILHDRELNSYTYSGTFDNRSISQIMSYIELSSPIYYKIDKETITIYAKK